MKRLAPLLLGLALLAVAVAFIRVGVATFQRDIRVAQQGGPGAFAPDYHPADTLIPWPHTVPLATGLAFAVAAGWVLGRAFAKPSPPPPRA